MDMTPSPDYRVIFCHKHPTSALLRFFILDAPATVCLPDGMPALSSLIRPPSDSKVVLHPMAPITQVASQFGFEKTDWAPETEYVAAVDVPGGPWPVLLARFTTQDPPFLQAKRVNGGFVDLTKARHLPSTELQLLRLAYETLMEG
jgi:hypothetical protein